MKLLVAFPFIASIGVLLFVQTAYTTVVPSFLQGGPRSLGAPKLVDQPLPDAVALARSQGYDAVVARSLPTDNLPADTVLAQEPAAGARLKNGQTIRLTVSAGYRPPNVVGSTLDQARVALMLDGWKAAPDVEVRPAIGARAGVVIDQRPRPAEGMSQRGEVTLVVAAPNLAAGSLVQTSIGVPAPQLTDGEDQSVAWVPGNLPHWLEIDLGGPATVAEVRLLVAAEQPTTAAIELWAWNAGGQFTPLHLFTEEVGDQATLVARLSQPAVHVTKLRVATTSASSPLGFREISVLDR